MSRRSFLLYMEASSIHRLKSLDLIQFLNKLFFFSSLNLYHDLSLSLTLFFYAVKEILKLLCSIYIGL